MVVAGEDFRSTLRWKIGVPLGADRGTVLTIKRRIRPDYLPKIDFSTASYGAKLRHLRKHLGVSIIRFSKMAGIAHNSLGKLECDKAVRPDVRSKLMRFLKAHYSEAPVSTHVERLPKE